MNDARGDACSAGSSSSSGCRRGRERNIWGGVSFGTVAIKIPRSSLASQHSAAALWWSGASRPTIPGSRQHHTPVFNLRYILERRLTVSIKLRPVKMHRLDDRGALTPPVHFLSLQSTLHNTQRNILPVNLEQNRETETRTILVYQSLNTEQPFTKSNIRPLKTPLTSFTIPNLLWCA